MEFNMNFGFRTVGEEEPMKKWLKEFSVEIIQVIDGGMYGQRHVDWRSPILTDNKVVRGKGYDSQHGFSSRTFSSTDKLRESI